jgi:hypothetical protein
MSDPAVWAVMTLFAFAVYGAVWVVVWLLVG